jgi:hypothetical protein
VTKRFIADEEGEMAGMSQAKCPKCSGEFIKRVSRRGAFELLLSLLYIYPFRCQLCGHRFKLLRWRKMYRKALYDRREFERRPVSLKTSIWGESGEHGEGVVEDLSMLGCGITAGTAFREGSIVRLELHVPQDATPIVVQAGVVRHSGSSHSEIEFLRMQHSDRERLRALVQELFAERSAESDEKKAANA